ncbi:MAG: hypothetical protein WAX44_03180 [Minisyncoccia bacterium]
MSGFLILLISILLFLVLVLTMFFLIVEMIARFSSDAPFVNSPEEIIKPLVNRLSLNDQTILFDLGCGDAQVIKKISKLYPETKIVGVEGAVFPYLLAKFNTRKNNNIEIRMENFFNTNLEKATHIFIYLYPKVIEELMPVLEKKCKPGTMVISCDFEDKNREAEEIIDIQTLAKRGKRLIVYKL